MHGRRGRALRAIRDGEIAAVSSGISLAHYKTLAFGVSAFFAGVAGGLYGILNFTSRPERSRDALDPAPRGPRHRRARRRSRPSSSGRAFVEFMPLYAGDILAPVINTVQRVGVPVDDIDPTTPGVPSVVYGVVLLLVLFAMPNGAAGLFRRLGVFTKRTYSRLWSSNSRVIPSRRRA